MGLSNNVDILSVGCLVMMSRSLSMACLAAAAWRPARSHGMRFFQLASSGRCGQATAARVAGDERVQRVLGTESGEQWLPSVGLEVHAQIASVSKLFSPAMVDSRAPVNTTVGLFDAAIPGTLPVLNRRCVEAAVQTALALNCHINDVSTFDRKHYFYADLPAGYQITQQAQPLAVNGRLDFVMPSSSAADSFDALSCSVLQLHLEQDSGKSLHDVLENSSLIDLNRCGNGLMEIVFGPDLFSGDEAAALITELCLLLRSVESCSCLMEEGALRVDANVSVRRPGQDKGVRTEIKNLNSIRSVKAAVEFEVKRHIALLSRGQHVDNDTMTYDVKTKSTVSMRSKESKLDYRFMPEPNLPPLRLSAAGIDTRRLAQMLPALPAKIREQLMNSYGLNLDMCFRLMQEPQLLTFFLESAGQCESRNYELLANYLLSYMENWRRSDSSLQILPHHLAQMVDLRSKDLLNLTFAKLALECATKEPEFSGASLYEVAERKGWLDTYKNPQVVEDVVQEILSKNDTLVRQFKRKHSGKQGVKLLEKLVSSAAKRPYPVQFEMVAQRLQHRILQSSSSSADKGSDS